MVTDVAKVLWFVRLADAIGHKKLTSQKPEAKAALYERASWGCSMSADSGDLRPRVCPLEASLLASLIGLRSPRELSRCRLSFCTGYDENRYRLTLGRRNLKSCEYAHHIKQGERSTSSKHNVAAQF